jgi:hypothetical protein
MFHLERLFEKRIVPQIKHAETKIHTRTEICIHLAELILAEGGPLDGRPSDSIRGEALDLAF